MSKVYVLRSCDKDMRSYGGFQWPKSGYVRCPDWNPEPECGSGLHGLLHGVGDFGLCYKESDAHWLIVEVDSDTVVDLGKKVKFPEGNVIFCEQGTIGLANSLRKIRELSGEKINSAHAATTSHYAHAATMGDYANATTTGIAAHAVTAGNSAHAATTSHYAHAVTAGYSANAATTSHYAHAATTGKNSIACCLGLQGQAKTGENGSIILTYWCNVEQRHLHVVGYVGRDGVKSNTWYTVRNGKLSEVT